MLVLQESVPSQRVDWAWDGSISDLGGAIDTLLPDTPPPPPLPVSGKTKGGEAQILHQGRSDVRPGRTKSALLPGGQGSAKAGQF